MTSPCRWPECHKPSAYFARDNRATYGHLCVAHWYRCLRPDEQKQYSGGEYK